MQFLKRIFKKDGDVELEYDSDQPKRKIKSKRQEHEEEGEDGVGLEKYSLWVLLSMLFLLPVFFLPAVSIPFQFTKTVLVFLSVLVLVLLLLMNRLKDGDITMPFNKILYAAWLLPVVYFFSSVFSISPSSSFFGQNFGIDTFSFIALMGLFITSIVMLVRTKEQILSAYLVLFVSFIVVWLFQGLRLLFGADFLSFGIFNLPTSNIFGKWNDLAIFFGLATVMSFVTLASLQLSVLYKRLLYVMLIVSLFFLAVVNFNIVWIIVGLFALGFFVHSISVGIFSWRKVSDVVTDEHSMIEEGGSPTTNKTMTTASFMVLIIAGLFIFGGSGIGDKISAKFGISQIEARPSWESTIDIAQKTYSDKLLFGSGPNTFVRQWVQHRGVSVNETIFWNADFSSGIGIIPTAFVSVGIIGGLAWLLFIGMFFYSGFRMLILTPVSDRFTYFITLSAFLAGSYLWILAIVYTPNIVLVTLAFFFTGIYITSLRHHGQNMLKEKLFIFENNPKMGFVSVFMITSLLLVLVVGIYTIGKSFITTNIFLGSISELTKDGDIDKAEAKIMSSLGSTADDRYYRVLADINIGRLNLLNNDSEMSVEDVTQKFQQYLSGAVHFGQLATESDPTDYQNWLVLGKVYQSVVPLKIQGAYESAKGAYETALSLNPDSPAIHLLLARLEVSNGNNLAARGYIETSLSKKTNYTEAIFLLSQIEIADGNINEAIESVKKAAILEGNNPVVFFQLGLLQYNQGDYKNAEIAFKFATDLNPDYANAKYFLGLTYSKLDKDAKAIVEFEEVLVLNPGNEEVIQIIENLRGGKSPFAEQRSVTPPEDREDLPIDEDISVDEG